MANNVYRSSGPGKKPGNSRKRPDNQRAAYRQTETIRHYADDNYDDDDYEWQEREVGRKARNGCLIAFLAFLLLILLVLVVGALIVKSEVDGNNSSATAPVVVDIGTGYGGKTVGELLEENGVIGNAFIFRYYVQFKDVAGNFQAGRHTFQPGMSYDEIIKELTTAPPPRETVDIRIQEGFTIMAVANEFEKAGLCTAEEFLAEADNLDNFSDLNLIQKLKEDFDPVVFHAAEGYLFPDTYTFYTDDTVHNYVRKLYEEMDKKITPEMYQRMEELGLSLRETITLASMIQKESGDVAHQPAISGVFWNRLSEEWQAQDGTMGSDVTVHYIRTWMQWNIPEYADVPRAEISYDAAKAAVGDDLFYAYCTDVTYPGTRKGLPSGPICSVSADAIKAALYPEANDYYYFVADKYGDIYYGKTLQEHNKNVQYANSQNAKYDKEQAENQQQTAAPIQQQTQGAQTFAVQTNNNTPPKWGRIACNRRGGKAA